MILILFDTYHSYAKVELLTNIGPFLLMMGDALFNRVYMPVGMMLWYTFGAYTAAAFYSAYMSVGFQSTSPRPEFQIFNIQSTLLEYMLPLLVPLIHYIGVRIKLGILREGDIDIQDTWHEALFAGIRCSPCQRQDDAQDGNVSQEVSFVKEQEINESEDERQKRPHSGRTANRFWASDLGRWQAKYRSDQKKLTLKYLPKSLFRRNGPQNADLYNKV